MLISKPVLVKAEDKREDRPNSVRGTRAGDCQWLRAVLLFQETRVQFVPTIVWCMNAVSGGSDSFFWPLRALHACDIVCSCAGKHSYA